MKKLYAFISLLTFCYCFAAAQKPVANFSASKDSLCANDCISFSDSSLNNPTSWKWTFTGGTPQTSSDQNPAFVCYLNSGNYDVKLVVSNSNGSDSVTKINYISVFSPPPFPVLSQSGDTIFFSIDSANTCYKVDGHSTFYDSTIKQFYIITDTCGNFNLSITDTCTGCSVGVGIIVSHPFLPLPVITQHGCDTLFATTDTSYLSYQWFDSTTLIPGQTRDYLVISHEGNYNVEVCDKAGCCVSVGIVTICVGVDNLSAGETTTIYPSPASNELTVHSSQHNNEMVMISIIDLLGETVQEQKLKWSNDLAVNISLLRAGIYFLEVKTENGSIVKKFVKE